MTRSTSHVLIDHVWEETSRTRDALWTIGFSLLTALLAQIKIPLPYTTVPLTGQTFSVLLSGAVLGSRRGFLSQALYLARSEEHTSELQSPCNLVCRLLLEKKKKKKQR